jgi:hypothetical protein
MLGAYTHSPLGVRLIAVLHLCSILLIAISARKYDCTLSVLLLFDDSRLTGDAEVDGDPASTAKCHVLRLSGSDMCSSRAQMPLLATSNWTLSSLCVKSVRNTPQVYSEGESGLPFK